MDELTINSYQLILGTMRLPKPQLYSVATRIDKVMETAYVLNQISTIKLSAKTLASRECNRHISVVFATLSDFRYILMMPMFSYSTVFHRLKYLLNTIRTSYNMLPGVGAEEDQLPPFRAPSPLRNVTTI